MRIIISPAKKMVEQQEIMEWKALPAFVSRTDLLLEKLKSMSYEELKHLWGCNDKIAMLNVERLQNMELRKRLTPAILAYEGIQYQYMAPEVFTYDQFAYVEEHLRILSGFYGVLRPMDGVTPYRLEMQAKLPVGESKDLYQFWGGDLADHLMEESDSILNLASKEYSQCIAKHLRPGVSFITCIFGELKDGKVVEKGTRCKMARGEMVCYMAEHGIEDIEAIKKFDRLNYVYSATHSTEDTFVFCTE